MKTGTIRIGGMTCASCQNRIEKKLKSTVGIEAAVVNFNDGTALVTWNDSVIALHEIEAAVERLGYTVAGENAARAETPAFEIIGTLAIILSLYLLLQWLGPGALTSAFPLAEAGVGYGMLFVIGLVTSVHCAAMCGGINLSQCIPSTARTPDAPREGSRWKALVPAILYNAGRVVSYTTVGVIVGAVGQAVAVSGRFQGAVQLAAGVFMVIMGINMLGVFPALRRFNVRMPKIFARKIDEQKTSGKSPLFIGLLNGLMPCGPLQAMQLYALSTGSPIAGGASMFLFSVGTVPLMFGIGALSGVLSDASRGRAFTHRVMKIGAILVIVMGMTMFTYGWGLSGFNGDVFGVIDRAAAAVNPFASNAASASGAEGGAFAPVIENGVQIVNSTLSAGRYPAITVQRGIPVKWTITAPQGSVNGCNNRMIIREYKIERRFTTGENVIEFTPDKAGKFPYSCWMGMIRSSIMVVEEGQGVAEIDEPGVSPSPAGVTIPAETVALAEMQENGCQLVKINLRDDGIDPAIVVVQRNIPAMWIINNDSLDPGNSLLLFPSYYTRLDMEQGDNVVQLLPNDDFDFSTGDSVFYGYVKVVDDLEDVDVEAIKAEASAFETLIYPDAYFDAAAQGEGCCGGGSAG
ncbi:MAG: sulfite exporter TauE/SafE family protein [Treponema sp.]|jgi:sulfite exporter TauE/SafE/copper chaperone CopZ/plastocyanin domain-containing protein|nr:sulfite exporter TauE/SafE family protein [Treponema sp.]